MKSLLVFATLSILTVSVSGQPYNASDHKQQPAAQTNPSITVSAPEKHNDGKTDKGKTYTDPSEWHTAVKRPEWWLVLLGFITCGVVGWQAWETRRAAQATQVSAQATLRSIKLQQVQLRQRVEIGDWEATTPHIQPTADQATLKISFSVFNPTEMVLTLETILATAGPIWEPRHECISHEMRYVLAPDSGFPVSVKVPMKGDIFTRYKRGDLSVVVTIDVVFDDAFNVSQSQRLVFSGNCHPTNRGDFTLQESTHAVQEAT